jgi:hypothetical protein
MNSLNGFQMRLRGGRICEAPEPQPLSIICYMTYLSTMLDAHDVYMT